MSRIRKGERKRYRDSWCAECRLADKRSAVRRLKANEARQRRLKANAEVRAKKLARDKAYYIKNRAKRRHPDAHVRRAGWLNERLRRKYGITLDEYMAMAQRQSERCAICGRPEMSRQRRLAVDHDHERMVVRALLCHHCNTGLGNFGDDPALLEAAIAYLAKHGIVLKVPA